jgi:transcriptional regulator with XRE-family HTH domain
MPPRLGRVAGPTTTLLGAAIRERRGESTASATAEALGVSLASLTRIELGVADPSFATAIKLARWLGEGWSAERVFEEAGKPAPGAS